MSTIEVDPRTRIRVEYDTDAEDPRWWGDHIADDDYAVEQWRAGEVYGVIVERKVDWTFEGDIPDGVMVPNTMTTWEEIDSIWGCYLDDTYTARVVANEYFGIPLPETLDGLSEAEIESVYYESESGCEWGHTFRPCPHDDPNDSDEIENESE